MNIRDRIGVDIGRKLSVEDAVKWAAENDVTYIDCQIDVAPNALQSFDESRAAPIRDACAEAGVHLGLHTLSAVNIAEFAPVVSDAVDIPFGYRVLGYLIEQDDVQMNTRMSGMMFGVDIRF